MGRHRGSRGSAGCVLAARLSETPGRRVLLVEAETDTPPGANASIPTVMVAEKIAAMMKT